MAKTEMQYFGLQMQAEGEEMFCHRQTAAFLDHVAWDAKRDETEKIKWELLRNDAALKAREQAANNVEWDVVAVYDDAGIPSFMHRFRRVTNAELFGGSEKVHPAFIIGGEVYDEIYISVYQNVVIDGKPYSLPHTEPVTNISMEDFAEACFSKGEGWHCLTAAEWGLLANTSAKLGTLPHGNTDCGKWDGDEAETGKLTGNCITATGTGPVTWTHDHTETGVHDLCGNIWEFARGMRIWNGALQAAENNDAALPETDLSEGGTDWKPVTDDAGNPLFVSVEKEKISFTTDSEVKKGFVSVPWGQVTMEHESEQLKALAFHAAEPDTICAADSADGEYMLIRGGDWSNWHRAGVFSSRLDASRFLTGDDIGGRSAYFKKKH